MCVIWIGEIDRVEDWVGVSWEKRDREREGLLVV